MAEIIGPYAAERRQLDNPFIVRELAAANEAVKAPQRRKVADYFLAFHRGDCRRLHHFGLPGVRWAFEHLLADAWPGARFTGVERNYRLLEAGRYHMPGHSQVHVAWDLKHRNLAGYRTNRAEVYWCHAGDLLATGRSGFRDKDQHKAWVRAVKIWTCAWLDFSAPLGDEYLLCVKNLEGYFADRLPAVPAAFTFQVGRERPGMTRDRRLISRPGDDSLASRVAVLRAAWESNRYRDAAVDDAWTYASAGGTTMGVVLARFRLRRS